MKVDLVVITNWNERDRTFEIPNWAIDRTGTELEVRSERDVLVVMSVSGWRLVATDKWLYDGYIYSWLYFERQAE